VANDGMTGGFDKRILAGKNPPIKAEVERCARHARRRLHPSCDHSVPRMFSWENFRYFTGNA